MEEENLIKKIQRMDAARDSFPGEHWLVLAAGVGVWWWTRDNQSWLVRSLGLVAATALVGRAASGRDGLSRVLRYTPLGGRIRHAVRETESGVSDPALGR